MIRPARLDEQEALIELKRRASLMWEEDRPFLLANPDVIDLPSSQITEGHVFVWDEGGEALGFAVVLPRADGVAELDGLFVTPERWGEAIGRRLVGHGLALAREREAISLDLVANIRALGFYQKCGFQALGEVEMLSGRGVRMVRPLG
jgi:GNAT superfamily N-acetyltransferase